MTDPRKLVERVRELTQHPDGEDHGLERRERPPRSQAQRERVEGAAVQAVVPEQADRPADGDAG
jgi:hypothetical protein